MIQFYAVAKTHTHIYIRDSEQANRHTPLYLAARAPGKIAHRGRVFSHAEIARFRPFRNFYHLHPITRFRVTRKSDLSS